jgi:uncharacterized membrane-anchored protein
MRPERFDAVLQAAIAEGVLPVSASAPDLESRPWPVVLMIGLGAWLATIPLLVAVGLMLGDVISRGAGPYIVGALLLAGAIVVFRAPNLPVFVEQLALPALLVGGGALAFGLYRDMTMQGASVALALFAFVVGVIVERAWLRVLLGAAAAVFLAMACVSERAINLDRISAPQFWIAWHSSFVLWMLAKWGQQSVLEGAGNLSLAGAIESITAGWLLATLVGFAWLAGMTFLVGASLQDNIAMDLARELASRQRSDRWPELLQKVVSVALAIGGLWWGARNWPSLRRVWCAGVAAVLLVLAWFMPVFGAVLLALFLCATTQRWLQAGAAGVAAAWIIGAFYYQLRYPLAEKALLLAAAGAALGALAWFARRTVPGGRPADWRPGASLFTASPVAQWGGIVLTLILTLAVANFGIWQKEDVIAHGQPVYVELVPVDPRSLMQGDYMRLNFRLPGDLEGALDRLVTLQRPQMIARRDPRGVAVPVRVDAAGVPLSSDEMRIALTPRNGRWILVTDAWYFREGDAQRWAGAKYGEFRVAADGRALLVGLADAQLQPIRP